MTQFLAWLKRIFLGMSNISYYVVGDDVFALDNDTPGDPLWLRGKVYQLLSNGKFRVSLLSGGITDVTIDQIKPRW